MLKEFREFITKGNLIEIAVAFIIAVAFAGVVASFTNVILSLVGAIFGGDVSFDQLTWDLNGTPIPYGAFLTTLVNFIIIAFILFLVIRGMNRLFQQEAAAPPPPAPPTKEEVLLTEIRDLLKARA